jgi:dipeptidyl aminopeptidase/acylaminoacyl peptidase
VTIFADLHAYAATPRAISLRLSPDGTWLALGVQFASGEPARYLPSIWRVPAQPGGTATRLTRSAEGESGADFLPDGSLLFASRRPAQPADKADGETDTEQPALWLLPAAGGEPRRVVAPPGGVAGLAVARNVPAFACLSPMLHGTADAQEDAKARKARKDAGVNAILHEAGLVRYWDSDLGPDEPRLLAGQLRDGETGPGEPRDLTPDAGQALAVEHGGYELTPDGTAVVACWTVLREDAELQQGIVVIDTTARSRATLLADPRADYQSPSVSPDGSLVAAIRTEHDTEQRPGDVTLVLVSLGGAADSAGRDLLAGFDRRPEEVAWAADSRFVYFTAGDHGRRPVYRVGTDGAEVVQITTDAAAYTSICPSPDGRYVYALRTGIDSAPVPVRIDAAQAGATPEPLATPAPSPELPAARLEEASVTAADGTQVRGWLVLPEAASAASPAPLLLWVHGGPISSWCVWSWRWNPWLMAARGYAVLMPDPALSSGYGRHMIERGHCQWGGNPYTDLMAITDAVAARPDIDDSRTAMMGGSYGGYMANWMAGHTDRFRAIVSHAGLWALDQVSGTTDWPGFMRRAWGDPGVRPEIYQENSPHRYVADIVTPMLLIHGDKDYRVPVGEALRQWADLTGHGKQVKFLYYPDENHWISRPGDAAVWYETVLAFLAEHVLGEQWHRPELL